MKNNKLGARLSNTDKQYIYKDILTKSSIAIHRYGLYHLSPADIANEIWIMFIKQRKMNKYDPTKGASPITFACFICGNMIKNYLRRGSKLKDDKKRLVEDTMSESTNVYFYNLAKEYTVDKDDTDD